MDRSSAAREAVGTSAAMAVGGELQTRRQPPEDGGRGEGSHGLRRLQATHAAGTHWIDRARDGIRMRGCSEPQCVRPRGVRDGRGGRRRAAPVGALRGGAAAIVGQASWISRPGSCVLDQAIAVDAAAGSSRARRVASARPRSCSHCQAVSASRST